MTTTYQKESKRDPLMELLDKNVFEDGHPFAMSDIRDYAYAIAFDEVASTDFEIHLKACSACQSRLAMIQRTDKGLTGEILDRVKVVIRAAEDPKVARSLEQRARAAIAAVVSTFS